MTYFFWHQQKMIYNLRFYMVASKYNLGISTEKSKVFSFLEKNLYQASDA
jgi:hypothetical protein